jgi:hypothetical protein
MITALADVDLDAPEAELIDQLTALEKLKAAAAAAQAKVTVAFDRTHTERMTELHVDAAEIRRSVRAQVALARRDTRAKGDQHVATAAALVRELPRTLAALAVGNTSERAAAAIAREVAHLPAQQRGIVDAELADRLAQWGYRRTEREARRLVIRLDPAGAADRAEKAAGGRRVTIRPAPNAMTYLTAPDCSAPRSFRSSASPAMLTRCHLAACCPPPKASPATPPCTRPRPAPPSTPTSTAPAAR